MTHQFKTSCRKEKLQEIRQFVTDVMGDIGLPESDAHKVILAVDEVCANLIIHSNKGKPDEQLELYVEHDGNKVRFEIVDHGIGFDYTEYKEPNLKEIIKSKRKGGLGIMLVKKIMDEVEFKCEKSRNVCCMVKKFHKK